MTIESLRYFVTAAKSKSFSDAAAKLFISPQGLSQGIRRLEQELGFPLFHRGSRKLQLTDAGEEIFSEALRAVEAIDAIGTYAVTYSGAQQRVSDLRIGLMKRPLGHFLESLIRELAAELNIPCSFVFYDNTLSEARRCISSGIVDLIFIVGQTIPDWPDECQLISNRYYQPVVNRNSRLVTDSVNGCISWTDLDGCQVFEARQGQCKKHFEMVSEKYGIQLNIQYSYDSYYCLSQVRQNPDSVFFAPMFIRRDIQDDDLTVVHLMDDPICYPLSVCRSRTLPTDQRIEQMLQTLSERFNRQNSL